MSSCAKETCIHSSVCMYYADRCTTNGDCSDFKPTIKRPHAEWLDVNGDGSLWKCSKCGETIGDNYCGNCGRLMRKNPKCKAVMNNNLEGD